MLKVRGTTGEGVPLVILGLSDINLDRLRDGRPIPIDLRDLDLPKIIVVLVAGKDERVIAADLEENGFLPPGFAAGVPEPTPDTTYRFRP